jgi:hypothetical protein
MASVYAKDYKKSRRKSNEKVDKSKITGSVDFG